MAATRDRRWIWAVLFVTVFPVTAIHFSCVAILGPGNWGSGIEEKKPTVHAAHKRSDLTAYIREWQRTRNATRSAPVSNLDWAIRVLNNYDGEPISADRVEATGQTAILARSLGNPLQEQKLYMSASSDMPIQQINIPREMFLQKLTFLREGPKMTVVFVRSNSWAISPIKKLNRYWKSWLDPTLRPEHSLYTYDGTTGAFRSLGPGGGLKASPDRSMAVIVRAGAIGTTLKSLHVWIPVSGEIQTIASLSEVNPGLGYSFDYGWSSDSKAVFLWGTTGGFHSRTHKPRKLRWVYLPSEKKIFSIQHS